MATYTAAPVNARLTSAPTYLTTAQAFVIVGKHPIPGSQSSAGFGYQLSEDLVTWTEPQVMGGPIEEEIMYPTMLDPSDTSLNFERFGAEGMLFYSTDGRPPKAVFRRPVRVQKGSDLGL
jgi:hypothetical protein